VGILSLFNRGGKRAKQLYAAARDLIDEGRFEDALAIARKLRKLSYSGAYEIEGMAYAGLDRHEDAVRVIREGLQYAPNVWLNWHLLGNCLSDLGRFDEAMTAFDRAAACSGADISYVNLNRAVAAVRAGDHASALTWLDGVHSESLRAATISTRISALRGMGRSDEALDLAMRTLREWTDTGRAADEGPMGAIAASAAGIRRENGESPLLIRNFAIDYWRATRNVQLLWLIRDVMPQVSTVAKYFRILIHVQTSDTTGYYTAADVVADDQDEAMRFVREIEDLDGTDDVNMDEVTDLGTSPDPKGVYALRGRTYYREDSQ